MQATLYDYVASVPSTFTGFGVLPGGIPIPANIPTGPLVLADLGISVGPGSSNRVELNFNAQFNQLSAVVKTAFFFQFLRDGLVIWSGFHQLMAADSPLASGLQLVSFSTVDFNLVPGFHTYTVQVYSSINPNTSAVAGPVVFSGASYTLSN
ncbi:hypothetical protein SY83_18840 [Paenibacillus swuensis]|uniref:Exosporium protein C n=1 Tax=Paenibacillus swuensis TaxID=1178515 RepID=A0A172TLU8_9BACL|nr:hypothetical protein [Paenibacillus swuensis]ANE48008.1 hypothetical protein SY83_18840 [Paenibacillus swuensis]